MINYKIEDINGQKRISINSINGPLVIDTNAPESAKLSFTATTDMQRSFGKLVSIDQDSTATVDTVWNNSRCSISGVVTSGECKSGDAIVITEHLTLSGNMELICSKSAPEIGDMNFMNLSWRDIKLRIDLLTGEYDYVNIN